MRDTLRHDVIVSYYLKSVALWIMDEKNNDPSFWKTSSLGYVFMTVLKPKIPLKIHLISAIT